MHMEQIDLLKTKNKRDVLKEKFFKVVFVGLCCMYRSIKEIIMGNLTYTWSMAW